MVTKKIKFFIYQAKATLLVDGEVQIQDLEPIMLIGKNKRKSEILKQFKSQVKDGATIYITMEEVEERTFECSIKQFLSIASEKTNMELDLEERIGEELV